MCRSRSMSGIGLVLRKDEVEHYGTQKDHCNGVLCEYGVDNVGEYLEHVGSGGESKSDA